MNNLSWRVVRLTEADVATFVRASLEGGDIPFYSAEIVR